MPSALHSAATITIVALTCGTLVAGGTGTVENGLLPAAAQPRVSAPEAPSTTAAGAVDAESAGLAAGATSTTRTAQPASSTAAHKILAVKIPNVMRGDFPQVGLPNADLVYTELVEGGLTRHVAIFSSSVPPKVRPMRSLRETDLQLLPQFGRIGVAFSGMAGSVKKAAGTSGLKLFSEQVAAPEVYRDGPRCEKVGSIYCVALSARQAMTKLSGTGGASVVRSLAGLQTGRLQRAAGKGTPVSKAILRYPARLTVRWESGRYRVSTAGLPSQGLQWDSYHKRWNRVPLTATNVIIQSVSLDVARLAYRCRPDWKGGASVVYQSQTVGSGSALLLRGGRAYPVLWSRSALTGRTSYRFATPGHPQMRVAEGRTWIFLLPETGSAVVGGSTWKHPLPQPRLHLSSDERGDCRHPVATSSRQTDDGAVITFLDEWPSLAGRPVQGVKVWLTDAAKKVTSATTDGNGSVLVPAARLETGWVRVTMPGTDARVGAGTTVLRSLSQRTAVNSDVAGFTPFIDTWQRTNDGTRSLYLRITALYAGAPVAWQVQRRPAWSDAEWTAVTPAQLTRSIEGSLPVRFVERQDVPASAGYEWRVVVRDGGGLQKSSNVIRVGG
ncbi:MAG: DUF3048 domain-containing protein [Actinobacteria bacterium]|nr:DUF3048 domain-containing protein [Actinomycetota bacterium]